MNTATRSATRGLIAGALLVGLCSLHGCGGPSEVGTIKLSPKSEMKIGEAVKPLPGADKPIIGKDQVRSIKDRPKAE